MLLFRGFSYVSGTTRFPQVRSKRSKQMKSLCESLNSCFLFFPIARNLVNNEKIMTFRSPCNVTHNSKTVIFITTRRSTCENRGFSRIALEFI